MNDEMIKSAVRAYIDSIKNESWYSVDLDDAILESFKAGADWYRDRIRKTVDEITIVKLQ